MPGSPNSPSPGARKVIDQAVWDMVEPTNGCVMAFSGDHAYLSRGEEWQSIPFPILHPTRHPPKSVCATAAGEVLAFGLGRWTGEMFEPHSPLSMVDVIPEAIRTAPDGALWCLDRNLLCRWDPKPGAWLEYTNLPPPRFLLPSGDVLFISERAAFRKHGEVFTPLPGLTGDPTQMEMDRAGNVWTWTTNSIACYGDEPKRHTAKETGLARVDGLAIDGAGTPWFYGVDKTHRRRVAYYLGGKWERRSLPKLGTMPVWAATGDPESGIWLTVSASPGGAASFVRADSKGETIRDWRPGSTGRFGPGLVVDGDGALWAYGEGGVHYSSRRGEEPWRPFAPLRDTLIAEAMAVGDATWFVFAGDHGGASGFGCYRRGEWLPVTASMTLFWERGSTGQRAVTRAAYTVRSRTLCLGSYNAVHLIPGGDLNEYRRITLPGGRSLDSAPLVDAAGTLWMGAQGAGNESSVLAFRSDGVPVRAFIQDGQGQVAPGGRWQLGVAATKRFEKRSEFHDFQYSWRFDSQPWTPFQAFPADGLSVGGLDPGAHTLHVKARDEGGTVQIVPTTAALTVLSPPWQEQSWFRALVWGVALTIVALAAIAVERARKLALTNGLLLGEVEVRRRTEQDLQSAQTELQKANQSLEERVQARTTQLARSNESLREQMAERERMEQEQRRLEAKMLQTQKLESLGVLAGGIAHDFNNLLTTIVGHADLASSGPGVTNEVRESLQTILATSRRAGDLCLQLLAYSGRGRFHTQRVHLSALVRDTAQMLEVSVSKQARLRLELAPELPLVEADVTQLQQIVMNLVINASEAIGDRPGEIRVSTRVARCDRACLDGCHGAARLDEGDYVALEVADTGCGVDAATLSKMFDPFFTTKFTGRGLGLAAVLGIVQGHRGAIRVLSEPGRGARFAVLLPPASPELVSMPGVPPPAPAQSSPKRKGRILVVDDEAEIRTIANLMLKRLGYEAVSVPGGPEAIELIENAPASFDCVLLDWTMPRMNGIETFRALRERSPELRAILASGACEEELAERFHGNGLAGFVQKPYSGQDLAQVLDRVLSKNPSEAEALTR